MFCVFLLLTSESLLPDIISFKRGKSGLSFRRKMLLKLGGLVITKNTIRLGSEENLSI